MSVPAVLWRLVPRRIGLRAEWTAAARVHRSYSWIAAASARPRASFVSSSSVAFHATHVPSRSMFIQTESTPNEDSLKFLPGCTVMEKGLSLIHI